MATFTGTSGNDNLTGTSASDTFNMQQKGEDIVNGEAGNDIIKMGAYLDAGDQINGGDGNDTMYVHGDYSLDNTVDFNSTTITSIERIDFGAGDSYDFTQVQDSAESVIVNASLLDATDHFTWNTYVGTGSGGPTNPIRFITGLGTVNISGGNGADTYDLRKPGDTRTIFAGKANDLLLLGGTLTANDSLNGEGGNNVLRLDGDYSAGVTLTNISGMTTVQMDKGFSYDFTVEAGCFGGARLVLVNASGLTAGESLTFDASAQTTERFHFVGGAGDDVITSGLTSGRSGNIFDLSKGGSDTASGWGNFILGSAFDSTDSITGTMTSSMEFGGHYTSLVIDGAANVRGIEELIFDAGHSYSGVTVSNDITASDGVTVSGKTLTIDASALTSANFLSIDLSNATSAAIAITGGAGNDKIVFGGNYVSGDTITGGGGSDTVTFNGDYSAGVTIAANAMEGVSALELGTGHSYTITLDNQSEQTLGPVMRVNGSTLGAGDSLVFDGSAEASGLSLHLIGGAGNDTLEGGFYSDQLTGGGGDNVFKFFNQIASTSSTHDTITDLNFGSDSIALDNGAYTPTSIETAVTTGTLNAAANTFDSELAAAIGSSQLSANGAVLFTPDAGTLAGHTFLIVDHNGTAGYQTAQDYVIDITGYAGTLALGNFT